jgi:hypothetical protein
MRERPTGQAHGHLPLLHAAHAGVHLPPVEITGFRVYGVGCRV